MQVSGTPTQASAKLYHLATSEYNMHVQDLDHTSFVLIPTCEDVWCQRDCLIKLEYISKEPTRQQS